VLFTASVSGLIRSPFSPFYSAAKFALVGLARSLAKRHDKDQIRFNVLYPGTTDTAMLRVFMARPDQKETLGMDPEDLIKSRAAGSNALGRYGQPEDVVNAALFSYRMRLHLSRASLFRWMAAWWRKCFFARVASDRKKLPRANPSRRPRRLKYIESQISMRHNE